MASRRSESPLGSSPAAAVLQRELRRRLHWHLYDESGVTAAGAAIYSLADPREVRLSRYVGQTAQPARRLMQHLRTARLWLPDETPWWIEAPRLRPLYHWSDGDLLIDFSFGRLLNAMFPDEKANDIDTRSY